VPITNGVLIETLVWHTLETIFDALVETRCSQFPQIALFFIDVRLFWATILSYSELLHGYPTVNAGLAFGKLLRG